MLPKYLAFRFFSYLKLAMKWQLPWSNSKSEKIQKKLLRSATQIYIILGPPVTKHPQTKPWFGRGKHGKHWFGIFHGVRPQAGFDPAVQVTTPLCEGCKFENPPKKGNYLPLVLGVSLWTRETFWMVYQEQRMNGLKQEIWLVQPTREGIQQSGYGFRYCLASSFS